MPNCPEPWTARCRCRPPRKGWRSPRPRIQWTAQAEEYWPDIEGLELRNVVTDFDLPPGTFFDSAVVHVLTTGTLNRLR